MNMPRSGRAAAVYPGCQVVPGVYQGARIDQVRTSAYTGYYWARLGRGRGRDGPGTVHRTVPEPVPEQCH